MEKSKLDSVDALPVQHKPQELVATPNFDPAEIIKKNIYVTYWRACLKHLTIVNRKPKSEDAERSSRILKNLEFRVSAVWAPKTGSSAISIPCAEEDKITFREFIIERKQSDASESKEAKSSLAEPSPDTPEQGEAAGKPADQKAAEGA
ncbi:MAG: hypothetical protein HYT79_02475 [Elusimicrobia bacterium]|nr:hypothetical protein [Elusimicrobiota bacterium]